MEREKENGLEKGLVLVYTKDSRRDRAMALLRLCPKERVCEIERIKNGEILYPVFPRRKFFPLAA